MSDWPGAMRGALLGLVLAALVVFVVVSLARAVLA